MDTFVTWEYLLSFAGCVIVTGIATQFIKPLLQKVPTQLISYIIALVLLLVGQAATGKLTGWDAAVLDVINGMVVSLASNGGYDALNSVFGAKTDAETELKDEGDE